MDVATRSPSGSLSTTNGTDPLTEARSLRLILRTSKKSPQSMLRQRKDVDTAVAAARPAFTSLAWRDLSATGRGKLLHKLAALIEDETHKAVLATIDTRDNGKPYSVAFSEDLVEAGQILRYFGGYAHKGFSQVLETSPARFAYTAQKPLWSDHPAGGLQFQILSTLRLYQITITFVSSYQLTCNNIAQRVELSVVNGRLEAWPRIGLRETVVLKPAEQIPLSAF